MTEQPFAAVPGPADALEPWPDTVAWQPVSPKLITVELIARITFAIVDLQIVNPFGSLMLGSFAKTVPAVGKGGIRGLSR